MFKDEDSPSRTPHLFAGYPGRVLILVALGTMMTGGTRLLVAPLLPTIRSSLVLSQTAAGMAVSVMWALAAVSRYAGGRLADQLSRKTVLVASLGIATAGSGLLVVSRSFPLFLLSTALIGAGGGLFYPAGMAQISDLFVARRGQAIGVNNGSLNVGGLVTAGVAAAVVATTTWRNAFIPAAAFGFSILVFTHVVNDGEYTTGSVSLGLRETVTRLVAIRKVRLGLVAYVLLAFTWQGVVNFLPAYLQAVDGFSPTAASGVFAVFFVIGIVSNPLAGRLGDRFGFARIAVVLSVVAAGGLSVFVLPTSLPVLALGFVLMSVGLTGLWSVMGAFMLSQFPDASLGGDFGAVSLVYLGIGSLGPTYVGILADYFTFTVAFAGFLPCLAVSAAVMFHLSEPSAS